MTFLQLLLGVRDPIRGRAVFDPATAVAGITGGASLIGGILGSNSADKAADASAQAAADSNATQLEMFYQGRADLAPQRQASQNALAAMQYELGLGPLPYFSSNPTVSDNGDIEGVRYAVNGEVPLFGGQQAGTEQAAQAALPAYATSPGGNVFANVGTNSTIPAFNPLDYPDEGGGAVNAFQHYLANLGEAVAGRPAFQPTMGASYGAPAAQQQTAGGTGQATGTPGTAWGGFKETPGYQYRRGEALSAAADYSAARGLGLSGAALKEQQRIGDGMAAAEYGDFWNRLASTADKGQTASSASAQLGQNYAGAVGANNAFAAAGQGSAYQNQANAWGGALGGVAGAITDWLGNQQTTPTTPTNVLSTIGGGYVPGSYSGSYSRSLGTGFY